MGGVTVGMIFFIIGMLTGIACSVRGVYLAIKSSYTEPDGAIWCWVGAGICIATANLWPIVAIFASVLISV